MSNPVHPALAAYREAIRNGLYRLPGKAPAVWTILCLKWRKDETGLASPGLRRLAEDYYGELLPGPEMKSISIDKRGNKVERLQWLKMTTQLRLALKCLERMGWVKVHLKPAHGRATTYEVFTSPCPESDRVEAIPCPESGRVEAIPCPESDRVTGQPCPKTSATLSVSGATTPFERPMVGGIPKRNVEAPETDRDHPEGRRIRQIEREDLIDPVCLNRLYRWAVKVKIITTSQDDRHYFFGRAANAVRCAKRSPGAMFAHWLTLASKEIKLSKEDEEKAHQKLQALGYVEQ
jgi:hypothetical protein